MTTLTTFANRLNARTPNSAIPSLLFVTDETRIPDALRVISQLPRGTGIILRDDGVQRREDFAASIAVIARRRQLRLLIGSDGDLARQVGAAGLHLPENQSRDAHRWRMRYPNWLVTVAAHSASGLRTAAQVGADAALLSPVFPTQSHPDRRALGVPHFCVLSQTSPIPVIALGGIVAGNVDQLSGANIVGIAAIGGLASEFADTI